ncbi:MAG: hypothetical protein GTN76_14015 [Candidatus Aenigmarchaeota archaeon]|nr:hypothetical protein [Candidatus Aenigmarchaeota archaeon]
MTQEEKNEAELQYEVTVTLKLIQVYVTDKKGNPVLDLTKDDFFVFDNGHKQTLTEFERACHFVALAKRGGAA